MSAEMTPLDHILQSEVNDCNEMSLNVWRLVVDEASAELNQLRAASAERDELKRTVQAQAAAWQALTAALDALQFSGTVDGLGRVADARAMWPQERQP